MPLQSTPLNVPLISMNQAQPKTAGPPGRIQRLINGIVRKRDEQTGGLRVEKRKGFEQLAELGTIPSTSMSLPTTLSTLGDRLILTAQGRAFYYSNIANAWIAPSRKVVTETLRAQALSTNSGSLSNSYVTPDSARLGSGTMHTWIDTDSNEAVYDIRDDNGVYVVMPQVFTTGVNQLKCASDGTNFWMVYRAGATLFAWAFSANGTNIDGGSVASSGSFFDIIPGTKGGNPGIFLVQKDTASTSVQHNWIELVGGTTVTFTQNVVGASAMGTGRVAFLRNDRGDGRQYIVGIDGAGPYNYNGYQTSDTGTNLHTYTIAAAQTPLPMEVTGYVAASGNADITVLFSFPDTATLPGPYAYRNFSTLWSTTFAGASNLLDTRRSLTVVARPISLNGTYYFVMFYQADTGNSNAAQQSTFFLMESSLHQICGNWDAGIAYADWQHLTTSTHYMHVASVYVDTDNGIHFSLMYRARSSTARTETPTLSDDLTWQTGPVSTIGLKEFKLGPDSGIPFEASGTLFMPGPGCTVCTGNDDFVEDGIDIVPELNSPVAGGAGNIAQGPHSWVATFEWTNDNGERVIGPMSKPASLDTSGLGGKVITVTGTNTHVSRKFNLRVGLYRSTFIAGAASTSYYKVTSDITPTYNVDGSVNWTFVDNNQDTAIAVNERAYTSKGFIDRFPAPAHRGGVANADRVFLIGYDNAVWFSGPKTEGDAWWFTPLFRIPMPSTDEIRKLILLDNILVIMCANTRVHTVSVSRLPGGDGVGSIPSPMKRPIFNGCTGHAVDTNDGIWYASAQGGIWLMTQSGQTVYAGSRVKDDVELNGPITSIAQDIQQRIVFLNSGNGKMLVYDQITNVWGEWQAVGTPTLLATHLGQLVYATSGGNVWRQVTTDTYADFDGVDFIAYPYSITIAPIHFGGVRNFCRVWNSQIEGAYRNDHQLAATITYYADDFDTPPTSDFLIVPDSSTPYVYELPLKVEEVSALGYIFAEFATTPDSAAFALEALAFEVAVDSQLGRLPDNRRINES